MSPSSILDLVGLALACGAAEIGGPLTMREVALARRAAPVTPADARRVRAAIRDGADPLGVALCALRSPRERRPLGAFYTSGAIVGPMVSWALDQRPARFVDPGCGSGRFAVAAVMRDPALEVVAVDLDPLATLLTRAALAAAGARTATVIQGDYLRVRIPRIAERRTAFVGNPPYVRHHDLDAATKALAPTLAASIGCTISGLAGLHALFYLATLAKHGVDGDVGSFVTSAEWLDVGYGAVVRELFVNGLGGRSLTVFDPDAVPFGDAMTTAAITTFRLGEAPAAARIARVAAVRDLLALEAAGRDIERPTLARAARWSPFLRDAVEHVAGQTIGTMFRVSRGQVTGANDYFLMTPAQARERGLEAWCIPVVTAAKEILDSGGVVRNAPGRMLGLAIPPELDVTQHPRLAAYLRAGEVARIHERYVAKQRRPWYAVAYPKPQIVATYMARQAPVFARNPDGLGLLNNAHGLHPRRPLDDATLERIVAALNAARATFVGHGRTYHGGLEKFEPREMEALPLEAWLREVDERRAACGEPQIDAWGAASCFACVPASRRGAGR